MVHEDCLHNRHIQDNRIDERYVVLETIGSGGMACVYKVQREGEPYFYALKMLRDHHFTNPTVRELFLDEARRLIELRHPNIVSIYDSVQRPEYAYFLMEFVDGFVLSQILKNLRQSHQTFPPSEAIRTLVQIARALTYLHEHNVIHRDIKGGNILVERHTGKVLLADFGIATDTTSIETISVAGTRAYMPPEQQEDLGIPVTPQADQYAFGVLAYEMLAGNRPYSSQTDLDDPEQAEANLIRQHREALVPSISVQNPNLPDTLDPVFERVLAKHPDNRYPDVRAFIEDLHAALRPMLGSDLQTIEQIKPIDQATLLAYQADAASGQSALAALRSRRAGMWLILVLVVLGLGAALLVMAISGQNDESSPATGTSIAAATTAPTTLPTAAPTDVPTTAPTNAPTTAPTDTVVPTQIDGAPLVAPTDTPPTEVPTDAPTDAPTTAPTELPTDPPTTVSTAALTDTPATTLTPTLSPTAMTTATFTPIPTTYLSDQVFLDYLENSAVLGIDLDLATALDILRAESSTGIITLNSGPVNGFRVTVAFNGPLPVPFGIAYRIQDETNYGRLVLLEQEWRAETIQDGTVITDASGVLPAELMPAQIVVMGWNEFLRFEFDDHVAEALHTAHADGQVGLWLPDEAAAPLPVESLTFGLVGDDARAAAEATPFPVQSLSLIGFVLDDVHALQDAADSASLAIECAPFMATYESLDRHLTRGPAVQRWAQAVIDASSLIYTRCRDRRLPTISFEDDLTDFLDWESALQQIAADLE